MTDPHRRDHRVLSATRPGRWWLATMAVPVAAAVTLAWAAAALLLPADGWLGRLALLVVPPAGLWGALLARHALAGLRAEVQQLQATLDTLRPGPAQPATGAATPPRPVMATTAPATEAAVFASTRRDNPRRAPAAEPATIDQPGLALDLPANGAGTPISRDDFISAIDFPDNAEDEEGFRCLRLALQNPDAARLIRATQDVLTLLAQDGIYVDDLVPERARVELWRRFAAGERGRGIAALGGIHDRSSLALTADRLRRDTIFHDAALHFLRQFDRSFQDFAPEATDQEIARLAETRTARAFMLLARVKGVFD